MTRIFLTLAILDGLALTAGYVFGWTSRLRGAFLSGQDVTWMIHLSWLIASIVLETGT